ncbi:ABC transporter ATP-binding protein [Fibrisoma montanum]|uniref:ABC transporter ATP-binding protein n=1 Tax=Fibrisoma montanum TaxID=2305895 RepID=A0A418M5T9_9BACT|nr:ABC transporter ATP-binding protein [Fibrisoma montanum]RIV21125.1 ABC transporter ATP-binding protein [Fibrisoma montanum]
MSASLIELQDVNYATNRRTILHNVSLTVPTNSVVGLLGPNGSGKSTILNLISGIIRPTAGRIHIGKASMKIGVSFGDYGFFPEFDAIRNLRLVAQTKQTTFDPSWVDAQLHHWGLWESRHQPFRQYSAGMKQKLSLIGAVLGDPDLLLLDEPINHLDWESTQLLRQTIEEQRLRSSIVLASHDILDVDGLLDYVVLVKKGTVAVAQTSSTVSQKFGSVHKAYIATFHRAQ